MTTRAEKLASFHALHQAGKPLLLYNVWDAGSARAVAGAGASAIATGSWSVAAAHGYADGEKMPLDLAVANLARIVTAVDLPVSVDIESGYASPDETVARMLAAGAVGCNIEDSHPVDGSLREPGDQAGRIAAIRRVSEKSGDGFFINARIDVFFQRSRDEHDEAMVAEALERARRYIDAGADGIFLPGLQDLKLIEAACRGCSAPLNVMVNGGLEGLHALAMAGVARISHGPAPYLLAMKQVGNDAAALYGSNNAAA